ncbi:MAG: hypothetical protein K6G88_01970 [Lachnospiraceae bacterium]|nr:hypothetical protein [Lachnospiraceae bacterium]
MPVISNLFEKNITDKTIFSFEIVTLHTSGMRFVSEHEILVKGGKAEISLYGIRFSHGENEDRRVLEKRAICSIDEVLKLLNDCKLLSWDGFDGPHPKNVLDGTMFRLNAVVNGDKTISAQGSQNFPKHYRDFTDGLYNLLNNDEEKED